MPLETVCTCMHIISSAGNRYPQVTLRCQDDRVLHFNPNTSALNKHPPLANSFGCCITELHLLNSPLSHSRAIASLNFVPIPVSSHSIQPHSPHVIPLWQKPSEDAPGPGACCSRVHITHGCAARETTCEPTPSCLKTRLRKV